MPLAPKTRLGTYEILALLGAGGMGEVYRAKDLRLGRQVAIKVLHAEVGSSPERLTRFEHEARTVAGLNHPNIVTLHSIENEDSVRFLTMELVEGQTLSTLVAPGGISLPKLLELAMPLADALGAAHEKGVIHRDLKPGNVMVTREGRVKVLDFGIAKSTPEPVGPDDRTQTIGAAANEPSASRTYGTAPYMSPEQIRGEHVDARSDLFAFGIVLYELATGHRPFTGATPADVTSAILRDEPIPLSTLRGDLPRDLHRIVERCMEKGPCDRFQTARDVYNELRYVQRDLGLAPHTPAPTPTQAAAGPRDDVASIAVLPFVNRSPNEEDEYFSDGLADELLHLLAKIRGLRVIARASSFRFRGTNEDPAVIGAKLHAATLLDGSVRKSGKRVRISVQLVKAADGVQLWSDAYDRSLEDILTVQQEIAQSVVKELRISLLGETPGSDASGRAEAEVAAAARGHGRNSEAHRLYLQGKYYLDRLTKEDTSRALAYLNEAVTLDATHVLAWLEISRAHGIQVGYSWGPTHESHRKAREAVDHALELAPDSAEAHARLANLQLTLEWDWKGAKRSLRRALELSPNNNPALRSWGTLAHVFGRFEEAEVFFRRAIEQDPLNSFGYHSLGNVYAQSGRLDEAEKAYRTALDLASQRAVTRARLSLTLVALGRGEEALLEANREPEDVYRLWALAIVHHNLGHKPDSEAALRRLIERYAGDSAYQVAQVYGARGEADRAFEWLDRSYSQRDSGLTLLKNDAHFASLRADRRWGAFVAKLGIDE